MHRVIVVGSPRAEGRSAHLADELFNACIDECPEDGVSIVSVASIDVAPCNGCDACAVESDEPVPAVEEGDPLEPCPLVAGSNASAHRCVIDDDMPEVRKHLDAADELIVVSPVYFAGAPAQFKALLDRMQPYFRSNVRRRGKRPMILHVVGEGGDPHGFEPLISTVRSAFAVAGFELELVLDWVGKIDDNGEITAEADEYPLPPVGGVAALSEALGFELVEEDWAEGFGADDFDAALDAAAHEEGFDFAEETAADESAAAGQDDGAFEAAGTRGADGATPLSLQSRDADGRAADGAGARQGKARLSLSGDSAKGGSSRDRARSGGAKQPSGKKPQGSSKKGSSGQRQGGGKGSAGKPSRSQGGGKDARRGAGSQGKGRGGAAGTGKGGKRRG